ncbi:MAG: 6-carboxytetrahydropterin synthase QueD [Candidatus Omnitrophica bacterium]|nr:6-carboxytetrahydropterin synthase QueD [Candidatus Omnitrophota bacterium]
MYIIKVEGNFSAAHNLRSYKGKCEELHGHNWRVEAAVVSETLDATGMVMDFNRLKMKLKNVLKQFDHTYINNIPYFKKVNPTSENIARYIYENLRSRLPGLKTVTVWENSTSSAIYEA